MGGILCVFKTWRFFFLTSSREVACNTRQPHDCDLASKTLAGIVAPSFLSILRRKFHVLLSLLKTKLKEWNLNKADRLSYRQCHLWNTLLTVLDCSWPNTRSLLSQSHLLQLSDPSSPFRLGLRKGSLPFSLWIVYHELVLPSLSLSAIP